MLDIRTVIGAIVAAVAILAIGFRLFGANEPLIATLGGDRPQLENPVAQQPRPASQRIAAPEKPAVPANQATGSIGTAPQAGEAARPPKAAEIKPSEIKTADRPAKPRRKKRNPEPEFQFPFFPFFGGPGRD